MDAVKTIAAFTGKKQIASVQDGAGAEPRKWRRSVAKCPHARTQTHRHAHWEEDGKAKNTRCNESAVSLSSCCSAARIRTISFPPRLSHHSAGTATQTKHTPDRFSFPAAIKVSAAKAFTVSNVASISFITKNQNVKMTVSLQLNKIKLLGNVTG